MSVRYGDVHPGPTSGRRFPDYWWSVDCTCRQDGPWTVLGPPDETYRCVRCDRAMTVEWIPEALRREAFP